MSSQGQQTFPGFSNALQFNTSQFEQYTGNNAASNQFQVNSSGSLHPQTGQFSFDTSQIPSQFSFNAQPAAAAAPQWSSAQFSSAAAAPQWSAAQFSAPQFQNFSFGAAQQPAAAAPSTATWSSPAFQSSDLAAKWSAITQNSTSAAAAFQQPHSAYGQFPQVQLSAAQIQSAQSQVPQYSAGQYGSY